MRTNTVSGVSEILFHEIAWYFDVPQDEKSEELERHLTEEAERRAKANIISGFVCGELCFSGLVNDVEVEYFGWWDFSDED